MTWNHRLTFWLVGPLAAAAIAVAAAATPSTVYIYDNDGNLVRATDTALDPQNCGGAGVVCSSNHVTPSCSGGVCTGPCASGFGDCNGNKQTDGCETSISADVNNCGGCGAVCSTNHVTRACVSGSCASGVCNAGYADCNGNKQTDGCETGTSADVSNCGGCGVVCSTNHITRACTNGSCASGVCLAGYGDCNGNKQTDGCETGTSADVSNCGGCGVVCSTNHIARACANGSCASGVCLAGYADCNGNKQTDGCESNVTTDSNNCGACGFKCVVPNGWGNCSAGKCVFGGCNGGYHDCGDGKCIGSTQYCP